MKPSQILRQELLQGRCVRLVVDHDGRSLRGIIQLGDVLTLCPISDLTQVTVGDMLYAKWKNGNYICHVVKEIANNQFLLVNSRGKVNGWVNADDVMGKVQTIERTGRSDVEVLLDEQLALGVAFYV
jgi:hypothetical protein